MSKKNCNNYQSAQQFLDFAVGGEGIAAGPQPHDSQQTRGVETDVASHCRRFVVFSGRCTRFDDAPHSVVPFRRSEGRSGKPKSFDSHSMRRAQSRSFGIHGVCFAPRAAKGADGHGHFVWTAPRGRRGNWQCRVPARKREVRCRWDLNTNPTSILTYHREYQRVPCYSGWHRGRCTRRQWPRHRPNRYVSRNYQRQLLKRCHRLERL